MASQALIASTPSSAFRTGSSAQQLQKMLSVKLYLCCALIFLTVILFSTRSTFPNSYGRFRGFNNLSQFQVGVASLAQERADKTSSTRKQNAVIEELISEDKISSSRDVSPLRLYAGGNQDLFVLSSGGKILQPIEKQFDQAKSGMRTSKAPHTSTDFHNKKPWTLEETDTVKEEDKINALASLESALLGEGAEQKQEQSSNCDGQRVYMYDLPPKFNTGVLEKCNKSMVKWLNFCPHIQNHGFGRQLETRDWYATDAYMLEVIFHARMKAYSCLTSNSSLADAFFIPYYVGLDALRYIYGTDGPTKHEQGLELLRWLEEYAQGSWSGWRGRDHFIVAGRTAWDFGNPPKNRVGGWGTSFLEIPAMGRVTSFVLEKRVWRGNEQAIPYPTSFHPSSSLHLQEWIGKVESSQRKFLFAFIGAPRPQMKDSIRGSLFNQCNASSGCTIVNCSKIKCAHNPEPIVESLLQARFCLQPGGDTFTRRSTFDSIIAGCIPVFFWNDSAYTQYTWHLPTDPDNYSVYIPANEIRNGTLVENILRDYRDDRVKQLQLNVRNLIQRISYTGVFGSDGVDGIEDAFEVSVKGMLNRVAKLKQPSPK